MQNIGFLTFFIINPIETKGFSSVKYGIRLGVKVFIDNNVEPNFASLSRQYGQLVYS